MLNLPLIPELQDLVMEDKPRREREGCVQELFVVAPKAMLIRATCLLLPEPVGIIQMPVTRTCTWIACPPNACPTNNIGSLFLSS